MLEGVLVKARTSLRARTCCNGDDSSNAGADGCIPTTHGGAFDTS